MSEQEDYTGTPGPTGPTGPEGPEGPTGPPGTTTWAGITDKPTEFAPEAHAASHEAGGSDALLAASYVNRWTRPGRLYASDGTTLKQLIHTDTTRFVTTQNAPENGDRLQTFFICAGTETKLSISNLSRYDAAIFDIYVNGELDSTGYDDYSPWDEFISRYITLSQPTITGLNTIELHVNGQNASSTGYAVRTYGISIQ